MGILTFFESKGNSRKKNADAGPMVEGRAKSVMFAPQASNSTGGEKEDLREDLAPSGGGGSIRKDLQGAKSFSYAQSRAPVAKAKEQEAPARSRCRDMEYNSIDLFSQKVELYRGGISTVYKAVCKQTSEVVIVKTYHKAKMVQKHIDKMQREIHLMQLLEGQYMCEFYATFEDADCWYIIMEYCQGGDLFKRMLMRGGALDEHWVATEIVGPILHVLDRMHQRFVVHRDIKPENIFLTKMGEFRLGDLGLAIKIDEELAFSRSGTLDYMAPEVLKNPSTELQEGRICGLEDLKEKGVTPYNEKVDVWAVGVLAYELVKGRPPFEVDDEAQTAALIMYSTNIMFPQTRSPGWADFVRCALAKRPHERPSAKHLLQHPWVQHHVRKAVDNGGAARFQHLLTSLPVPKAAKKSGLAGMDTMQDALDQLRAEFSSPSQGTRSMEKIKSFGAQKFAARQEEEKEYSLLTVERSPPSSPKPVPPLRPADLAEASGPAHGTGFKARAKHYFERQAGSPRS